MQTNRIVHIVDDDDAVRRTTARTVNSAGFDAFCFPSGKEFLKAANTASPGCILLDIRMPEMSGLQVLEAIAERQLVWPVLILTGHADLSAAITSLKQGALEFLQKPSRKRELVPALDAAFAKLDARLENEARIRRARSKLATLSPRETDVLGLLAEGLPHKLVAYELDISVRTVEVHRSQLLRKLGVRSLSAALRISFEADVSEPKLLPKDVETPNYC